MNQDKSSLSHTLGEDPDLLLALCLRHAINDGVIPLIICFGNCPVSKQKAPHINIRHTLSRMLTAAIHAVKRGPSCSSFLKNFFLSGRCKPYIGTTHLEQHLTHLSTQSLHDHESRKDMLMNQVINLAQTKNVLDRGFRSGCRLRVRKSETGRCVP